MYKIKLFTAAVPSIVKSLKQSTYLTIGKQFVIIYRNYAKNKKK